MPLTVEARLGAHERIPVSAARRAGAFAALLMMLASATGVGDSGAWSAAPQGASIPNVAVPRTPVGGATR